MSTIAEEIQRIKQAKSGIKTSIINKGVAVDDAATLDAYPALIDSIQTGGSQAKIKVGENGIKFSHSTFTEVPNVFDFSDVTDMYMMFEGCLSLTTVSEMDTSNVQLMSLMFNGCNSLTNISPMDTSRVIDMSGMFYGCTSLSSIPPMNTSLVTTTNEMFDGCSRLTTVPEMDTSNVTTMRHMFNGCSSLTTIPEMDASGVDVYGMDSMFNGCASLTNFGGVIGLKVALDLSSCTALTHDSIMNVINKAADVTAAPATLTLGPDNLAKLSDAEKAVATNKGWTLA